MIDPLREEAKAAIATCRGAGIRVSMITGDQPATAAEIARQLGLDRDARGNPLKTVHARELEGLDDEGWAARRRRVRRLRPGLARAQAADRRGAPGGGATSWP